MNFTLCYGPSFGRNSPSNRSAAAEGGNSPLSTSACSCLAESIEHDSSASGPRLATTDAARSLSGGTGPGALPVPFSTSTRAVASASAAGTLRMPVTAEPLLVLSLKHPPATPHYTAPHASDCTSSADLHRAPELLRHLPKLLDARTVPGTDGHHLGLPVCALVAQKLHRGGVLRYRSHGLLLQIAVRLYDFISDKSSRRILGVVNCICGSLHSGYLIYNNQVRQFHDTFLNSLSLVGYAHTRHSHHIHTNYTTKRVRRRTYACSSSPPAGGSSNVNISTMSSTAVSLCPTPTVSTSTVSYPAAEIKS